MKTTQIFLFALLGCTSFVFSQSYSGVLTHTNSYFTMEPFNSSYDDGSSARIFYDGNNKRIRFWNTDSGTSFTHIDVGNVDATGNITATGNVGIGTSSPTDKLHIQEGNLRIFGYNTSRYLRFTEANLQGAFINYDGTSNILNIGVNNINSTDLVNDRNSISIVRSTGNVGIGTTSPSAPLHINNGDDSYGVILANADESSFSLYAKTLTTSPNFVESFRLGLKYASHEDNGYISFYRGGGTGGGFLGLSTSGLERIRIASNGDVGIGTSTPDDKLTVKGRIHAEEVKVDLSVPGPDYVFKEGYDLKSLEEVQKHIREKGHLPNIPSAAEMEENGVELGIMNMKLLEKIEELTLYTIAQEKRIKHLEKENKTLRSITERMAKIEALLETK